MIPEVLRQPCALNEDVGHHAHKHTCPSCGETWAHTNFLNDLGASREEYAEAHTCPKCGTEQYWKVVEDNPIAAIERMIYELERFLDAEGDDDEND